MNRIDLTGYSSITGTKKEKITYSEEYKKLQEEANKRIEEYKRIQARGIANSRNFVVSTSSKQLVLKRNNV